MKKLFGFAVLLAAGLAFSACSSDVEDTMNVADAALVKAMQNNVAKYGTKSSTVSVYSGGVTLFGSSTRSANTNSNQWSFVPEYPSAQEIEEVMAYIATKPESCNWPGYTKYIVQHLSGAHHMYSYKDFNGAWHNNIDGTSSMEMLEIKENSGNWQFVYNFNCGKGNNAATHDCTMMTDGFKDAKAMNEYSASTINQWRLFYYKGFYYLGFDFHMKKGDGKIDGDGVFDDWVVKIIPYEEPSKDPDDDPNDNPGDDPDDDPNDNPGDDPSDNPGDNPGDDPSDDPKGNVEIDVHHQKHNGWNAIKTSIHLRDTMDVRAFIPIPEEYQAVADDFDIRTGIEYGKLGYSEVCVATYEIAGKQFQVDVKVNHTKSGIEILIAGADCAEALKQARAHYQDGITFEIFSYVIPETDNALIWSWVQNSNCYTSTKRWPADNTWETWTYGQFTSAFYTNEKKVYNHGK